MAKPRLKQFIIRKYVMAKSAIDALKKEHTVAPDDCWISEEWLKNNPADSTTEIGFKTKKKKR